MGCFCSKELHAAEEQCEHDVSGRPSKLSPALNTRGSSFDVETPSSNDATHSALLGLSQPPAPTAWRQHPSGQGLPKPDSAPDLLAVAAWSVGGLDGKQAPRRVISMTLGTSVNSYHYHHHHRRRHDRHGRHHGRIFAQLAPAEDSNSDATVSDSDTDSSDEGLFTRASAGGDVPNSPPNVQQQQEQRQQQQQQLRRSGEGRLARLSGTTATQAQDNQHPESSHQSRGGAASWRPIGLQRIACAAKRVMLGVRGNTDDGDTGVGSRDVDGVATADGHLSFDTIRASSVLSFRDAMSDMLFFMSVRNHDQDADGVVDADNDGRRGSNQRSQGSRSGGGHHQRSWRERRCKTDLPAQSPAKRTAYDWQRNLLAPAHPRVIPASRAAAHVPTADGPLATGTTTTTSMIPAAARLSPDWRGSLQEPQGRPAVGLAPVSPAHTVIGDQLPQPPLPCGPGIALGANANRAARAARALHHSSAAAAQDVPPLLRGVHLSDYCLQRHLPRIDTTASPRTSEPSVLRSSRSTDVSRLSTSSMTPDLRLHPHLVGVGPSSPCASPTSHYRPARSSGVMFERGSACCLERGSSLSSPRRAPPSRASSIGSGGFSCVSPSRGISRSLSNVCGVKGGGWCSPSGRGGGSSGAADGRDSSSRLLRLVEHVMLTDAELYRRVQQSSVGITSLAKETSALQYSRDSSGATCVNQYVIIKTLGRGSFGKVKLCLNTLDGQLYAVKMINRAHVQQQLQRPLRALRRKGMRASASSLDLHLDYARAVNRMPSLPDIMEGVSNDQASAWSADLAAHPRAAGSSSSLPRDMHRLGIMLGGSTGHEAGVAGAQAFGHGGDGGGGGGDGGRGGSGSGAGGGRKTMAAAAAAPAVKFEHAVRQSLDSAMMGSGHMGVMSLADAGVMREIAVMKKLDHPNVVKLHEVIDPPGAGDLIMILEYCEGGPVMETRGQSGFRRLSEARAWELSRQLCLGLDYLHYNNVVHGDLKPENLLLSACGQLKVADFGSSSMVSDRHSSTQSTCTPAFQAPELLDKSFLRPVPPFAGDVWALGCILFCFIYGRLPFQGSCVMDISHAILCQDVVLPADIDASPELRELLGLVLCKDPYKRITLQGIMEHPWLTSHGREPLDSMHKSTTPQQRIEVSRQDCSEAVDHGSLVSLLRARLQETNFRAGEFLYLEGEEAHCIYMIMSGVVELVTDLSHEPLGSGSTPGASNGSCAMLTALDFGRELDFAAAASEQLSPDWLARGGAQQQQRRLDAGGGHTNDLSPLRRLPDGGGGRHTSGHTFGVGPELSGIFSDAAAEEQGSCSGDDVSSCGSFSVELDDSLTLDCSTVSAVTVAAEANAEGKLWIDRGKAQDLKKRMKDAALLSSPEYVLEVKGPGQVLGLLAIKNGSACSPVYMHSARARDDVVLVKLTEEAFIEAALHKFTAGGGGGVPDGALHATHATANASNAASAASAFEMAAALPALLRTMSREFVMIQGLEDLESSIVGSPRSSANSQRIFNNGGGGGGDGAFARKLSMLLRDEE